MERLATDQQNTITEHPIGATDILEENKNARQVSEMLSGNDAYQAALSAGYDPNDPSTYHIAYNYSIYPPQFHHVSYYPTAAAAPGVAYSSMSPPLPPQSPNFIPQPVYYSPGNPTSYYPQSAPHTPPTGPAVHSPSLQPYYHPGAYNPNVPASPSLATFAHIASAPSSPPQQARYLAHPGSPPLSPPLHHIIWTVPGNRRHTIQFPHQGTHVHQRPQQLQPIMTQSQAHMTNIYIRGLPPTTSDDSLQTMCAVYGNITSSKAMIDQQTGVCKGYGFVMYETKEEADRAIEALSQMGFQVSFARDSFSMRLKSLQDHSTTNIYLSNLPLDMDESKLEELLHPYKTTSIKIMRDPVTNVSRGVGFARMVDRQSADAIIQKYSGVTLSGASAPLQARFADSAAQKKLKDQVVKRRMWKATQGYGRVIPEPLTPETVLGIGTSGGVISPAIGYYEYPPSVQVQGAAHSATSIEEYEDSLELAETSSREEIDLSALAQQKLAIRADNGGDKKA
ncbi:uncharacterized protein VTP21DRAFT_2390 [Calcarisporiella thermophila]|uniref:uncharacterized protein n=1 Tax=Calcarisporiella thermophila TaxID=911321 RepID=UPI0037448276